MGVQPKRKHFNKTLLFFDCKSNSRYKDNDCVTDVTFIQSVPVLHAENSVPTLSPVAFTPRKVIRHMTSDSEVWEIDLNTKMSFLNAAPGK